jgi:hypothetical protein
MTPEMASELDFIMRRVAWLEQQPRFRAGALISTDLRDEASLIYKRIEELEIILTNS